MRKTLIVSILCITLCVVLMAWGLRAEPETQETPVPVYILVLTEDKGTDIMQLKQGAQTAADEINARLQILTLEQDGEAGPQLTALLDGLTTELDGFILPSDNTQTITKTGELSIPWVSLWAETPLAGAWIISDYVEMGRLMAQAHLAMADIQANSAVAVFMSGTDREEAILEGLRAELKGDISIYQGDSVSEMARNLQTLPADTCVFTLRGDITEALASASGGRFAVWGVDPGENRVSLLEDGLVLGLAMEMPYAQGYLALTKLHEVAKDGRTPGQVYSPCRVVTRETMYLPENVKLVFPLLQ